MSSSKGWWDFCSTAAQIGMNEPRGMTFVFATPVNCSVGGKVRRLRTSEYNHVFGGARTHRRGVPCGRPARLDLQKHLIQGSGKGEPIRQVWNIMGTFSQITFQLWTGMSFKNIRLPFVNALYRIHEGYRFGLCMWPVSQFILIEEAFSFQLEKNRLSRH